MSSLVKKLLPINLGTRAMSSCADLPFKIRMLHPKHYRFQHEQVNKLFTEAFDASVSKKYWDGEERLEHLYRQLDLGNSYEHQKIHKITTKMLSEKNPQYSFEDNAATLLTPIYKIRLLGGTEENPSKAPALSDVSIKSERLEQLSFQELFSKAKGMCSQKRTEEVLSQFYLYANAIREKQNWTSEDLQGLHAKAEELAPCRRDGHAPALLRILEDDLQEKIEQLLSRGANG